METDEKTIESTDEVGAVSMSRPTPCSTPAQYWRESCLADRGYRFVRWDGECTVWQLRGVTPKPIATVKVTPAGETVAVSNAEPEPRRA